MAENKFTHPVAGIFEAHARYQEAFGELDEFLRAVGVVMLSCDLERVSIEDGLWLRVFQRLEACSVAGAALSSVLQTSWSVLDQRVDQVGG